MRGLWIALALLAGCYSPTAPLGAPCTSSAQCPANQVCNPNGRCERVPFDAAPDTPVSPDAAPDAPPIDGPVVPAVIAQYAFEGNLADETGDHPGTAVGSGLTYVAGAVGQAVRIPDTGTTYVRVEDSAELDLTAGTIELRFRFGAGLPAGDRGLLSRDAQGTTTDGHFSLRLGHDRRVVARIQRMGTPLVQAHRCTALPVAPDAWHRVVVSFGPGGLSMTVDGALAGGASWTDGGGTVFPCTDAWDRGIAGNDNPLVLGALTINSAEGTGAPVGAVANTLELDEVIVRAAP